MHLASGFKKKNRRKLPPVTATATVSTCTSENDELQETIITLTDEVDFLNEEVQDLEAASEHVHICDLSRKNVPCG